MRAPLVLLMSMTVLGCGPRQSGAASDDADLLRGRSGKGSPAPGRAAICHDGDDGPVRLEISERAMDAHLRHGDTRVTEETCDGIDNDCDGEIDEGTISVFEDFEDGAGDLELIGSAKVVTDDDGEGVLRLTPVRWFQSGGAWLPTPTTDSFTMRFRARISGGRGADGMTFAVVEPQSPQVMGGVGLDLGLRGAGQTGYAVEFDTFFNGALGDVNREHVAVVDAFDLAPIASQASPPPLRGGWMEVEVVADAGEVEVFIDGASVLVAPVDRMDEVQLGFTAGTGLFEQAHDIDDVEVTCD